MNEGTQYFQPDQPTGSEVLIYLYRPATLPRAQVAIYVNATKIVDLTRSEYTYFYGRPGKYVISTQWPSGAGIPNQEIRFPAGGGETYYVRLTGQLEVSSPGSGELDMRNVSTLELVPKDAAHPELKECSYFQPLLERLQ
ncbi:MAG TPA: DUF2846 domain-containing protein [Burkholderiales bacterium]|nr:DUF2846 domain-containing protein [Burkholderiales bacterium]